MAAAESATVFFARAAELGLGDLKSRFEARGWCSFADFAFACSDFKNSNPAIFEEEVIKPLVGEDVSRIPKIRRLFMQSYIVGSAEMERYANPQADAKVNMHPEDRAARTATLTKRLNGFTVTNQSEPSFGLIDKFANMLQKGTVRYVPWGNAPRATRRCSTKAKTRASSSLQMVSSRQLSEKSPMQTSAANSAGT